MSCSENIKITDTITKNNYKKTCQQIKKKQNELFFNGVAYSDASSEPLTSNFHFAQLARKGMTIFTSLALALGWNIGKNLSGRKTKLK